MEDEIRAEMGVMQPELDRIKRELLHEEVTSTASGSMILMSPLLSCTSGRFELKFARLAVS